MRKPILALALTLSFSLPILAGDVFVPPIVQPPCTQNCNSATTLDIAKEIAANIIRILIKK